LKIAIGKHQPTSEGRRFLCGIALRVFFGKVQIRSLCLLKQAETETDVVVLGIIKEGIANHLLVGGNGHPS
jgi:hypothetical protein